MYIALFVALVSCVTLGSARSTASIISALNDELDAVTGNTQNLIDIMTYSNYLVKDYQTTAYYWPCSVSSSVDICLSSIFKTMASELSSISKYLKAGYAKVHSGEVREHYYLLAETSFVSSADYIGAELYEAVKVVESSLYDQVSDLLLQEKRIKLAYENLVEQISYIEYDIQEIQEAKVHLQAAYVSIMAKDLYLGSKISALAKAKSVVVSAEAYVSVVLGHLYADIHAIYEKLYMMEKRQAVLYHWEEVLSVDVYNLNMEVVKFKKVEKAIHAQEYEVGIREGNLKAEFAEVMKEIGEIKAQLSGLEVDRTALEAYLKEIVSIYAHVEYDVYEFYGAYSMFSCEESLLYYQCVTSSAPAPAAVV